jgi:pantoate--beta-alanine ligase
MHLVHRVAELRDLLRDCTLHSFVPTMGNLHLGHLTLVREAAMRGKPVVVSIFVNRLQFAPHEDFHTYPRSLDQDTELLRDAGCDILFTPSDAELFIGPQTYRVIPPVALGNILEGQFRPSFFPGVCTVVIKLLNVVRPQVAVFGKKDYQQLLIVRRMVEHFRLPIEIVSVETVREADGLALSSRNSYLSATERIEACELHRELQRVAAAVRGGDTPIVTLECAALKGLLARGWSPDYVAVRRRTDLKKPRGTDPAIVLAAARLGRTRLIDNVEI